MAVTTVTKTIGSTGVFSTLQLWEDGAPPDLTTSERSAATTFAVASYIQGENINFSPSLATGKFLDTDSTGPGTGTYITYGVVSGNPAASDTVTGASSGATCVITSGTPDFTGVIWQGQCQNQEFTAAGSHLTITGSTQSSAAYKELSTASGASFRDHANKLTNALRYNASNGCGIRSTGAIAIAITVSETNARLTNLQIACEGSDSKCVDVNVSGATGPFDNLILEGTATGTSALNGVIRPSSATVRNCVIVQRASAADHIVGTGTGTSSYYNCTIVAPDDLATAPTSIFLSGASGTVTVQNCGLFAGDSTKAIKAGSATFNFTTCYSDISGTAGVTQTTYSNEFQNVNDSTRDFRLKTGANQINSGTTDATNAPTDIVGTTRPQMGVYDVSAWELIPATSLVSALMLVGVGP